MIIRSEQGYFEHGLEPFLYLVHLNGTQDSIDTYEPKCRLRGKHGQHPQSKLTDWSQEPINNQNGHWEHQN